MAITKLDIYNDALERCGERILTSLSEDRAPRRMLDSIWSRGNGIIVYCLSQGQWNFAKRTVRLEYNAGIEPDFGYRRAFDKPADLVRLMALSGNEYFSPPLLEYSDDPGYWFADIETIYVQFVSSSESYGADYSLWPEPFFEYVCAHLAVRAAAPLGRPADYIEGLKDDRKKALSIAKSESAMSEPTKFTPTGSWVRSRGKTNSSERGSKSRLIG